MPARSLATSLLCASMCLASVPIASAAEPPPTPQTNPSPEDLERGRELFENGKSLYLDGSYDPAVAAFKQAYAVSGDPLLLYNIAQAHDRADKYDDAIEYFEYYRAFAPASEREALEEKVASLQRRKLKAQAEAADADEPAETGTETATETPRETKPDDGGQPTRSPASGTDDPGPIFGPAAIALTAIAAVGLGAGIGLGVASSRRGNDVENACTDNPVVCPEGAESDLDSSKNLALGADIAFGVGAAAAVGAVVVIAINASRRKKATTAARGGSRVAVGVHRRGASLRVRF